MDEDGRIKAREVRGYGLLEKNVENKVYFYLHNEHGDVTRLVDQAEKTVNSYEYDVFGNTVDKKEGIRNSFRYAGEQYDTATGQYYLRARFYNPAISRMLSEDVYRGDGLNLYVYVANNPLKWIDPSGYASATLLPGELSIGTYADLRGMAGLTPHHMASNLYMQTNYGVNRDDGLCMAVESTFKNTGARHGQTSTYGRMSNAEKAYYLSLSPRDALAYDVNSMKKVLIDQGLYDSNARAQLQEFIKQQTNKPYTSDNDITNKSSFTGKYNVPNLIQEKAKRS